MVKAKCSSFTTTHEDWHCLFVSCDNLDWDPTILMWKLRFNTQVVEPYHLLRTYTNQDYGHKGSFGPSPLTPLHQEDRSLIIGVGI